MIVIFNPRRGVSSGTKSDSTWILASIAVVLVLKVCCASPRDLSVYPMPTPTGYT